MTFSFVGLHFCDKLNVADNTHILLLNKKLNARLLLVMDLHSSIAFRYVKMLDTLSSAARHIP